MIRRLCCAPSCSRYRLDGSDFCERHQNLQQERDKRREEHTRKFFENRPRTTSKFYHSSRWNKERQNFLRENPYCQICGARTTEIHHDWTTKDYLDDEEMFFDTEHWVPLCHSCHTRISNQKANRRISYEQ